MEFIDHIFAKTALPPIQPGRLYDYIVAGNGTFVRAWRPGLSAMIQIGKSATVRGLVAVQPYVHLESQVPVRLTAAMLTKAHEMGNKEILFYLSGGCRTLNQPWKAYIPRQAATQASVTAVDGDSGVDTLIELHSHHSMPAFFSGLDYQEESTGFRINAVIGKLDRKPEILVRVGIYGYFAYVPAASIFGMPAGLTDLYHETFEVDHERD